MLHDANGLRYLTTKECWRLMGFNDEAFKAAEGVVSRLQLYKQAGNSISINSLIVVFNIIFETIDHQKFIKMLQTL